MSFLGILIVLFLIGVYIITNKTNNNTYQEDFTNLYLNNNTDEKNIPSQQDE